MDFDFLRETFLLLLAGVPLLLQLAFFSIAAGAVLAVAARADAAVGQSGARRIARGYVFVFRGTPLLVQIFLIYYGLGQFPEIRESFAWPFLRQPYWCAMLALTLNTAAYSSEIIRGGILSVPFGQIEAARACGMSRWLIFRRIIVPQGLRVGAAGLRQRDHPDDPLDGARLRDHADGSHRHRLEDHLRDLPRGRGLHLRGRHLPRHQFRDLARASRCSNGGSRRSCATRPRRPASRSPRDDARAAESSGRQRPRPAQALRHARGAEGHLARRARGRRDLDPRRQRLGQVDAAALHQHAGDPRRGRRSSSPARRSRCARAAAAGASRSTARRSTGSARSSRWCSRTSICGRT